MRSDVHIPSGGEPLAAWLYLPDALSNASAPPVVVMAHGLGGVKEMRLDAYADRFADRGYAVLVFDYRHFGGSGGHPRQLLDIGRQLDDWRHVLAWVRNRDDLDADRVVLWGTSFGGGHVLQIAGEDRRVAAVIAQCPFTDGPASTRALGVVSGAKIVALALADLVAGAFGRGPVMVASSGPPRSAALMAGPGSAAGYLALTEHAPSFRNEVDARFSLAIVRHRPGRLVRHITAPVLFAVCETDTVAPPAATLRYAATTARGEVRHYPCGHFDIYLGEPFEHAVADYLDFLDRHVPAGALHASVQTTTDGRSGHGAA